MGTGSGKERDLVKTLYDKGFAAMRAPASGAMPIPLPDVWANRDDTHPVTLELKKVPRDETTKSIGYDEVSALKVFAERQGGKAFIGVWKNYDGWYFSELDDLVENEKQASIHFHAETTFGLDELLEKVSKDTEK